MKEYICQTCQTQQYSAAELKDMYFPDCKVIGCKGELRETDTSGLELAVLIISKK